MSSFSKVTSGKVEAAHDLRCDKESLKAQIKIANTSYQNFLFGRNFITALHYFSVSRSHFFSFSKLSQGEVKCPYTLPLRSLEVPSVVIFIYSFLLLC